MIDLLMLNAPTLRLVSIRNNEELTQLDYSIHLLKDPPIYEAGRKVRAEYFLPLDNGEKGALAVYKEFTDRFDESGEFIGLMIRHVWISDGGDDYVKNTYVTQNKYQAGELFHTRRQRALDHMINGAKGTPAEPVVVALWKHYKEVISEYVETGSAAFRDAVMSEVNPTFSNLLNINLGTESVRDAILRNLTVQA